MMNTVIEKYKSMTAPVRASLWFAFCNIMQKGIMLMSTPIFTRIMTTEQYGRYTIFQSWYSIISIFATLNLSAGILNNGLTRYSERKNSFISSIQGLSSLTTVIVFIIYLLNIKYWDNLLTLDCIYVFSMFVLMFFEPAFLFWATDERYNYRYKKLVVITIALSFSSTVISLIAVLMTDRKAEARVVSFVLVQVIVDVFFYIENFRKGKKLFDSEFWIYALKFNIPLIPHYLSMTILNQSDRIMINNIVGASEAAIYGIAYTLSMMMSIITNAINSSFIPLTYKSIKSEKYIHIRTISNILLLFVAFISIIAMSFCPELIRLFAPEEYYDAIWVMPPIVASVYFLFLYSLFANIEFYYEKTKFVMSASCFGASLNIVLNWIFINIFGYKAAGYTTLVCYMVFSVTHYLMYLKIIDNSIYPIYDLKIIVCISIFVLLMMIVMLLLYEYMMVRYFVILAITIIAYAFRRKLSFLLLSS